jgi:hypothetical protein
VGRSLSHASGMRASSVWSLRSPVWSAAIAVFVVLVAACGAETGEPVTYAPSGNQSDTSSSPGPPDGTEPGRPPDDPSATERAATGASPTSPQRAGPSSSAPGRAPAGPRAPAPRPDPRSPAPPPPVPSPSRAAPLLIPAVPTPGYDSIDLPGGPESPAHPAERCGPGIPRGQGTDRRGAHGPAMAGGCWTMG